MSDATRDYPTALKINMAAAELGPTIYYLAHRVYGGSGRMYEALSDTEQSYYRDVAEALLRTVAPSERQKRTPPPLTLVPPKDETLIPLPKLPSWCPRCHTRQESKHDAPYCSAICREAAQRAALYDRR